MSRPVLGGVVPPLITPLHGDGHLDLSALEGLIERLVDAGVGGIFVLGSSGEGPWFTPDAQRGVVAATVRAVAGRVPVLAGVLEPSAARVVEGAAHALDAGADAVVVTTPYYFAVDPSASLRHFERIAARTELPIVLYNIPQLTHNPLDVATVRSLLAHERIVGIKDSGGDATAFSALLDVARSRPDFRVFQGAERQALPALRAGAHGLVPGLANVAPASFVALVRAAARGEWDEGEAIQARIEALWTLHGHGPWLACLKRAVALTGYGDGTTLAGDALGDEAVEAIRRTLARHEGHALDAPGRGVV